MKPTSKISNQTYLSYGAVFQQSVHALDLARELGSVLPASKKMGPSKLRESISFQSAYQFAIRHAAKYERVFNPKCFAFGSPQRQNYWAHSPLFDGGLSCVTGSVDQILEELDWTPLCNGRESAASLASRLLANGQRAVAGFRRIKPGVIDDLETKSTALRNAIHKLFAELPVQDPNLYARNQWIYEQCCAGTPYEVILIHLKGKNFAGQINTVQSLIKAAKRHAELWELPPIPRRQKGRPRKAK